MNEKKPATIPMDVLCPHCRAWPGRHCLDINNPLHNPVGPHRARTEELKRVKTRQLLEGGPA